MRGGCEFVSSALPSIHPVSAARTAVTVFLQAPLFAHAVSPATKIGTAKVPFGSRSTTGLFIVYEYRPRFDGRNTPESSVTRQPSSLCPQKHASCPRGQRGVKHVIVVADANDDGA